MLLVIDFTVEKKVSVANLPSKVLTLYLLSALYLLERGKMADLVPLCVVTLRVALALAGLIPNLSHSISSVTFVCLSVETKVLLDSTSLQSPIDATHTFWIMSSFKLVSVGSIVCSNVSSDVGSKYAYVLSSNCCTFGSSGSVSTDYIGLVVGPKVVHSSYICARKY